MRCAEDEADSEDMMGHESDQISIAPLTTASKLVPVLPSHLYCLRGRVQYSHKCVHDGHSLGVASRQVACKRAQEDDHSLTNQVIAVLVKGGGRLGCLRT